ncbi:MAG TPA: HD domain-containing protein [Acidimicrobiales bacterium]|nr:HD domain-containing protein [Acidimicrobiales bacterium]
MVDVHQAQELARQLLAAELPRRWRHVGGVAAQAERIVGIGSPDRDLLVASAWLHDVGYASGLVDTGFHPIDGARHLRRLGVDERVVNLVAHHSCARTEAGLRGLADVLDREFPRDAALPHDELCFCDQTTSPDGAVVDVSERLAEIRDRYEHGHVARQVVDRAEAEIVGIVRQVEARYALHPR